MNVGYFHISAYLHPCLQHQAWMWIPKEMLLCILSEKPKPLFPFLLWAALNIISNECANLVGAVGQALLISKPACITVNSSCLFFMQGQNDESCLVLLWSRKDCLGSRLRDKSTNFFFFFYVVFSLTLSLGALEFTACSLHIPHSSPLAPLEKSTLVCSVPQSRPTLWPHVPFCSRNSSGKSNAVGCSFLLQGLFPTQVLTRVVWALGIRTSLPPQQRVQTRKPRWNNSPRNCAIIIEIKIFKKNFLPKYMSNTDLDN